MTGEARDPFKDTLLRYAGYANEVCEAFRNFLPLWVVRATYGIATVYGVSDAFYQSRRVYNSDIFFRPSPARRSDAVKVFAYTAVWQLLASVLIPPFFVNRFVASSRFLLRGLSIPQVQKNAISTGVGLAS